MRMRSIGVGNVAVLHPVPGTSGNVCTQHIQSHSSKQRGLSMTLFLFLWYCRAILCRQTYRFAVRCIRYFREEMKARNVYVINKLRWDHRALKNVPSALRDHNRNGGRKYEFPENVGGLNQCLTPKPVPGVLSPFANLCLP